MGGTAVQALIKQQFLPFTETFLTKQNDTSLTEGECVGDPVSVHVPGDKDENQVYKEDTQ